MSSPRNFPKMPFLPVMGALFTAVGLFLCVFGVVAYTNQVRPAGWEETTGVVVANEERTDDDGDRWYHEVVEYGVNGQRHQLTAKVGTGTPTRTGTQRPVWYDPENPANARHGGVTERWVPMGIMGGMGIVFTALGTLLLFVGLRERRRERLDDAGEPGLVSHEAEVEPSGLVQEPTSERRLLYTRDSGRSAQAQDRGADGDPRR